MQSYLDSYPDCAKHRDIKFLRAVNSVRAQSFQSFELIIISDGCAITNALYKYHFSELETIKLIELPKQERWSGACRNAGIEIATGEYITYLDTDDMLGRNHLLKLSGILHSYDWIFYDDYHLNKEWVPQLNVCKLKYGKCGTSNITHKRGIGVWNMSGYSKDDWGFIVSLFQYKNCAKVEPGEYFVCHVPRLFDV